VRLFSLGMGLCLIGTLLGGRVMTETGLKTNLYVITLAPSGTGKNSPLEAAYRLLDAAGLEEHNLGGDNIASAAAVWKDIETRPVRLYLLDEFGDLIGSVNGGRKDSHKAELIKTFKLLFTGKRPSSKIYANNVNNFKVRWHHVSIYGTGVPSALWDNLTMADVLGGFVSRTIVLSLDLDPEMPRETTDERVPHDLARDLKRLDGGKHLPPGERAYPTKGDLTDEPEPVKAEKTAKAMRLFRDWQRGYVELQRRYKGDPDGRDVLYTRIPEHAHKIALIYAASRLGEAPRAVEPEDVEYATAFMDWASRRFVDMVRDSVSWSRQDAFRRRVMRLARIRGMKGIESRELYSLAKDCTNMQVEDALKLMLSSGALYRAPGGNADGYVYRMPAASFMEA
jgi:hypothetical protein